MHVVKFLPCVKTCRDIETWPENQLLILRIEMLSLPENDVRVSVLYPMVFENLAIYHFQKNTLNITGADFGYACMPTHLVIL